MLKQVFSHIFLYAIGSQIPKVINLILLPILTQYLTANDYGIYGLAIAYISAMSAIKDLGMTQTMVNVFTNSKNTNRWLLFWKQQMGILTLWSIVYSTLLALLIYFVFHKIVGEKIFHFIGLIVLPTILFDLIIMFASRFYQLSLKPLPVTINTLVSGTVSLIISYICIVKLNLHYWGFFIASFVGSMTSAILYFYPLFFIYKISPIFHFKKLQIVKYFKVALPTIPHNYSSYLLNASDRLILQYFSIPLSSLGKYNFAYTFGTYAELFGGAVGIAVGPIYMREYAKRNLLGQNNIYYLTIILQIIFSITLFIGSLWMKEIFTILCKNKELQTSYDLGIIIIMGYAIRPLYWVTVNFLGYSEKTNQLWKISLIGGLINIILNLIFVPYYGVMASAISTLISLIYIGIAGFYLKSFYKKNTLNYHPLKWIIFLLTLTAISWVLKDCEISIKLIITVLLGGLGFYFILNLKNRLKLNNQ